MGLKEWLSRKESPKATPTSAEGSSVQYSDKERQAMAKMYQTMDEESRRVLSNPSNPGAFFMPKAWRGKHNNVVNDGERALKRGQKRHERQKNKNQKSEE